MRFKQNGNKADTVCLVVRNAESSATIPKGTPVVLKLTANSAAAGDGLDVVLPSTAGNIHSSALRYGVALQNLATGEYGEAMALGVMPYGIITRATRAASSDSWTSSASIAASLGLGLETINNAFATGASAAGSVVSSPDAFLIDSIASMAASATATSDTRTAITVSARVFVRML